MQNSTLKPKALRRKCAICKAPIITTDMRVKWCGLEHGTAYALQVAAKKKARDLTAHRKRERVETAARKAKLKGLRDYIEEAQVAFNAFIRERDKQAGYPCISSGRLLDWNGNAVDAGHYRSRGSAPHLRFNENNCHAQSKKDNRYGSGCAAEYRINLIKRIGLAAVEALECDNTPRKWTVEELIEIRNTYRAKLKALKAAAPELEAA